MSERSALITGGSAGIGFAIAERLVEQGWGVTLVARNPQRLAAAAAALNAAERTMTVATNLVKDESVDLATTAHLEHFGGMDMLVNNAGLGSVGPIIDKTPKALDLEIALNFRNAYRMIQASIPPLTAAAGRHGKALIVNVSSLVALATPPNGSLYAATKAALVALSRSAHAELSQSGIQVTALLPGFVDTPGTSWTGPAVRDQMLPASDVAEAVLFLLRTSARCFVPEIVMTNAGPSITHSLVDWETVGDVRR